MEKKKRVKKYSNPNQPILLVVMSAERTLLSNEQTFLSYIRSSLALIGGGLALIRFFGHPILEIAGWCLLPVGAATLVVGYLRFRRVRARLRALEIDEYRKAIDPCVEVESEALEALVHPGTRTVESQDVA